MSKIYIKFDVVFRKILNFNTMKSSCVLIIFLMAFWTTGFAQDTNTYITSPCFDHIDISDSCPAGINFRFMNDTLEIYGTIEANCCGEHFVVIKRLEDIISIYTIDTGQLCNCMCHYCFSFKIPASTSDTVIRFNDVVYHPFSYIQPDMIDANIELFPLPAFDKLNIITRGNVRINNYRILDLMGNTISSASLSQPFIYLNTFNSGMYFIQFSLDDGRLVCRRLIVR
jgi:hypothetical protein